MFLEISQNSQENTCGLFFNKVADLRLQDFKFEIKCRIGFHWMSCLVTLPSNNIRQWRIRVHFLLQFFEACWELSKSLIELRCLNECIFKKWGKGKRGENDNPFVPEGTTRLTFPVLISSTYTKSHQMISTVWLGTYHNRSSHERCSMKKVFLKKFAKFTWKYIYQRSANCRPQPVT